MTRRHERNQATTELRKKRRAFRKLVKQEARQDFAEQMSAVDHMLQGEATSPDKVVSHVLVSLDWIEARKINVDAWICSGKYKHAIVDVPSGIMCMTIEPDELAKLQPPVPSRGTGNEQTNTSRPHRYPPQR